MLACATAAVLRGVEAAPVQVECDLGNGLPAFTVVGLPDASVSEARDRVRSAITHIGEQFPMRRITVNLAPSDLPKTGPQLDLALALVLMVANGAAPQQGLRHRLFLGELGLSGEVRPVRGALAAAEAAGRRGVEQVVCPAANAAEAALAGLPVLPVASLSEALSVVRGRPASPVHGDPSVLLAGLPPPDLDLAQVRDQETARRALEIAAAGGHNVLMTGPPGAGKTLLARALPGILPPMTLDEALEVTRIHSAAGLLHPGEALMARRPFRSPHHGVSQAGMIGGGSAWVRPGEVTLAHRGVLMLDEFPEFPRSVLEALRQPLEDGWVTVTRARQVVTYPARFMLAAAMNPCPCGYEGTTTPCKCTPVQRNTYRQRVSGPLLDRIDLHVSVPRVDTDKLLSDGEGESSEVVRKRVTAAREIAVERGRRPRNPFTCNAEIPPGVLLRVCAMERDTSALLTRASNRFRLSARAVHRVLRVARTVADLAGADRVGIDHIGQAVKFRVRENKEDEGS